MSVTMAPAPLLSAAGPAVASAGADAALILIVEDDPNSAFILQKILLRTDYKVAGVARQAEQALELARATPPDLVLMDINLPGTMDGITAATELQRRYDIPVIYLSAYHDEVTLERARQTAPFAYLLKPYREKEVLITIQMALYKARLDKLHRAGEQRLAATLDALEDGVLAADMAGRVTYLNPAAGKVLLRRGFSAEGQPVGELLDLREQETLTQLPGLAERLLQPGFRTEPAHPLVLVAPTGENRQVHVQTTVLQDAAGRAIGCVIIFRDVTLLRQLEEGARQSQKLEAVGRLAGGIAHDFNNLLAIINSFTDLLLLKVKAGDPLEKYYRNIRAAGQRGADLVSQLMTFSRRAPATPRLVQLADIVTEAHKMLRPLIRENIELVLEIAPGLPLLHMDPGQVDQILVNLCLNSRDAIAENGRIVIQASVRVFTAAEALARDLPGAGEYVRLTVSDNGTGISPDIRGKIFEPFFTTKEVGKGTGLGLAMVYSLVQQSHGHIEVESELERGSTISIFLPAAARLAVATEGTDSSVTATPRGNERVLLVEDDVNFADCVKNILEIHGYSVTVARDGAEALERFREQPGEFDLLLADQVLPKIPGRRVAAELRRQQPDLRVLFMSGYDATDEEFMPGDSHTTRMQKPFSLQALLLRIRQLFDAPGGAKAAAVRPPPN